MAGHYERDNFVDGCRRQVRSTLPPRVTGTSPYRPNGARTPGASSTSSIWRAIPRPPEPMPGPALSKAATGGGSTPCCTWATSGRLWMQCGRPWLRSDEGNHDDVRPLQWHFSLSVQRDSRTTAGTPLPVLRDMRCWNDRRVWLLSSPPHETAALQSLRWQGVRYPDRPEFKLGHYPALPCLAAHPKVRKTSEPKVHHK